MVKSGRNVIFDRNIDRSICIVGPIGTTLFFFLKKTPPQQANCFTTSFLFTKKNKSVQWKDRFWLLHWLLLWQVLSFVPMVCFFLKMPFTLYISLSFSPPPPFFFLHCLSSFSSPTSTFPPFLQAVSFLFSSPFFFHSAYIARVLQQETIIYYFILYSDLCYSGPFTANTNPTSTEPRNRQLCLRSDYLCQAGDSFCTAGTCIHLYSLLINITCTAVSFSPGYYNVYCCSSNLCNSATGNDPQCSKTSASATTASVTATTTTSSTGTTTSVVMLLNVFIPVGVIVACTLGHLFWQHPMRRKQWYFLK